MLLAHLTLVTGSGYSPVHWEVCCPSGIPGAIGCLYICQVCVHCNEQHLCSVAVALRVAVVVALHHLRQPGSIVCAGECCFCVTAAAALLRPHGDGASSQQDNKQQTQSTETAQHVMQCYQTVSRSSSQCFFLTTMQRLLAAEQEKDDLNAPLHQGTALASQHPRKPCSRCGPSGWPDACPKRSKTARLRDRQAQVRK